MIRVKKVKKGSDRIVHKPVTRLQDHVSDGRKSVSSIFEFIKPRLSFWESNKKNKRETVLPQPQQVQKQEQIVKFSPKRSLKEWILNSPSSMVLGSSTRHSGRIHPSFEEGEKDEATKSCLRPRDGFCLKNANLKSDNDEEKKNASVMGQNVKMREKKVRFELPQVVDIFLLDSADGYYLCK